MTGSAGFIGARLVESLLHSGHDVVGVDNVDDSYDPRLKRWRLARLCDHSKFDFQEIDIRDRTALEKGVGGQFDGVFHFAARAGVRPSVADPRSYIETNVIGTLNVLDRTRFLNIPKVVFASTSSVYGTNGTRVDEESPTDRPLSPYAATKKSAEVLCHSYHHLYGTDVSILRFFTVYGPAGRPDMSVFRFVHWIIEGKPVTVFGDGTQTRDFTYVDDIVSGAILALKPIGCEAINLGSDAPVKIIDVIRLVEALTNTRATLEFRQQHRADVPDTHASIEKAKRILSWQPRNRISDGIADVVEWYTANRVWARDLI